MPDLTVTCVTAAIAVLMQFTMTGMTGMRRSATGTALGHGDDETLLRRIRAHGNFTETVPLALIMLGLLETNAVGSQWLWGYAASLLGGRLIHAFSILRGLLPLRPVGMMMTFAPMISGAVYLLWSALATHS